MSTRFAIFLREPTVLEDKSVNESYENLAGNENFVVATRSGGSVWSNNLPVLANLCDEVRVYPIGNTPQGIYTVGDIKKQINEQYGY